MAEVATTKPVKKTRKPREEKKLAYDEILFHASNLVLDEKAELFKELKRQIGLEVQQVQTLAQKVTELTKGI